MKLKHTSNFIKKDTVAIFVKVEKEKPKVSVSPFQNNRRSHFTVAVLEFSDNMKATAKAVASVIYPEIQIR